MLKQNWLIGIILITTAFTGINAQDNCPRNFLPQSGAVKGWEQKSAPECFNGESLFEAIDGAAEVYLEYGFVAMARSSYSRKKQTLDIEIYKMADPDAAFGILSNMNDEPPANPVNGSIVILKSYYGMAVKGSYYIIVTEPAGKGGLEDVITRLITDITGRIRENTIIPELISRLQIKDITRTVFFNGDIVLNNLFYLGIKRPFQYKHGIYFESKGSPFVVFICRNDISLAGNINSTIERFRESGKYTVDVQKNTVTNSKGNIFHILTEGNLIILASDDFINKIGGPGIQFWKN
jgi:hypothetical protein